METLQPPIPKIADGFWEYNCMLLMQCLGVNKITFTKEDQEKFQKTYGVATLSVTAKATSLTLEIHSEEETKGRDGK